MKSRGLSLRRMATWMATVLLILNSFHSVAVADEDDPSPTPTPTPAPSSQLDDGNDVADDDESSSSSTSWFRWSVPDYFYSAGAGAILLFCCYGGLSCMHRQHKRRRDLDSVVRRAEQNSKSIQASAGASEVSSLLGESVILDL
mmetsp:Transcript_39549/g.79868  ORF Transcript_39549/g.79868 Transcript_39549/m.79868 type:complete len:144 (-) Transcript_39549:84-515(-)